MPRLWIKISFFFLIITAALGTFLRFLIVHPVQGINYKYFLHSHSHVAFMGWVFNALFAIIILLFIEDKRSQKHYSLIFWLLQIAVVGMLITFPLQGYAAFSITFSTLHVFVSWWFGIKIWKDLKKLNINCSVSVLFIRWAVVFMVLSSIGPFALGYIMASGLSGSHFYQLSIYFYLHFQYNGWFTFAVIGIFIRWLELKQIFVQYKKIKFFLYLLVISCFLGYALSALWTNPPSIIYFSGYIATIALFVALFTITRLIAQVKRELKKSFSKLTFSLLALSFISFIIKILLQIISSFPAVSNLAFRYRNFTIVYLHLVFIGFVTLFMFAWTHEQGIIRFSNKASFVGLVLFVSAFVGSQLLLILQPIIYSALLSPSVLNIVVFLFSVMMAVSLFIIGIAELFSSYYSHVKKNK